MPVTGDEMPGPRLHVVTAVRTVVDWPTLCRCP